MATPKTATVEEAPTEQPSRKGVGTGRRGTMGVWIHYRKNDGLVFVQSLHSDQLAASTAALDAEIPGKVIFVPWDANIADVVK